MKVLGYESNSKGQFRVSGMHPELQKHQIFIGTLASEEDIDITGIMLARDFAGNIFEFFIGDLTFFKIEKRNLTFDNSYTW